MRDVRSAYDDTAASLETLTAPTDITQAHLDEAAGIVGKAADLMGEMLDLALRQDVGGYQAAAVELRDLLDDLGTAFVAAGLHECTR